MIVVFEAVAHVEAVVVRAIFMALSADSKMPFPGFAIPTFELAVTCSK